MKKLTFGALLAFFLNAGADNDYHYYVNLNKVNNDRLSITLAPPDIAQQEIEFMFPAMVPGTYEVYDFGRFISNFRATGKNGAEIKVTKVNVNTYKLSPADRIESISYDVDDTFDKTDLPHTKDKIVFEPGGANFEENLNFAMNTHCLFGYFKGLLDNQFLLEFEKPKGFYPSTGLSDLKIGETKDLITVKGYHDLVDSPIMYSQPDTATVMVGLNGILIITGSKDQFKIYCTYFKNTFKCSKRIFGWRITGK